MNAGPGESATRSAPRQRGFALLALLGVIGIGSVGILLAVQAFVPPMADLVHRTDQNLATVELAARDAFRRGGAFPADLDALAAVHGLAVDGRWRLDPWSAALDLDYRVRTTGLRLRSRGVDRRLGTGDDQTVVVPAEPLLRLRQRGRLRLLRAVLLRSPYRFAATMDAADLQAMRDAMRDYALARRSWLTADAAARVGLQARLTAAAATVVTISGAHGLAALPTRLVGAGGLMQRLSLPDTRCTDGIGRRLLRDLTVGFTAAGYDRRGGTDDDM